MKKNYALCCSVYFCKLERRYPSLLLMQIYNTKFKYERACGFPEVGKIGRIRNKCPQVLRFLSLLGRLANIYKRNDVISKNNGCDKKC